MLRHLGYVAIALSIDAPTNRTCRLRNATPARLRALIAENLADLERVLDYNVTLDVRLYRITSDIVPFASHPVNRLEWWAEFAPSLAHLGRIIRQHGMRVSMSRPVHRPELVNPAVASAAADEVVWHVRFLDALGVGDDARIVIHIGSIAGGREAAIARFAHRLGRPRAAARVLRHLARATGSRRST